MPNDEGTKKTPSEEVSPQLENFLRPFPKLDKETLTEWIKEANALVAQEQKRIERHKGS